MPTLDVLANMYLGFHKCAVQEVCHDRCLRKLSRLLQLQPWWSGLTIRSILEERGITCCRRIHFSIPIWINFAGKSQVISIRSKINFKWKSNNQDLPFAPGEITGCYFPKEVRIGTPMEVSIRTYWYPQDCGQFLKSSHLTI